MVRSKTQFVASVLLSLVSIGCGGGGAVNVQPPPPSTIKASSIVPGYTVAGGSGLTVFVNGSGFTSSSVIEWNGAPLATTFGSGQILSASLPSSLTANPGSARITVVDGNATSNPLAFGIASPAAANAGVIGIVSVAADGSPGNGDSLVGPSINSTGRYVAFQSNASNLVAGPTSGYQEIYERDTCIGVQQACTPNTVRITVTFDGSAVNFHSLDSSISSDGRYVAFDSEATNILPNTSVCSNFCVFLRDTCLGAPSGCSPSTVLVSLASDGSPAGGANPSISPDGRYIAFNSSSGNIVPGLAGGVGQAYVRDTCIGAPAGCTPGTLLVSAPLSGTQDNASTGLVATSATGRYFAFQSWATNIVANETVVPGDFWRDTCIAGSSCTPSTTRADIATGGSDPDKPILSGVTPSISADGRFVAFPSTATNLVSANLNGQGNVYLRDTCTGGPSGCTPSTILGSAANDGTGANCGSPSQRLSMSSTGRFIAFDSIATNLSPDDNFAACAFEDVFVRDTCIGFGPGCNTSTVRVSVINSPNPQTSGSAASAMPAISADGHYVVFLSAAINFTSPPSNGHQMVYLAKTGF